MTITFKSLSTNHLPLLLKWLETPHVKAWWYRDVKWTPKLIEEKFASYIEGYKIEDGVRWYHFDDIPYEKSDPNMHRFINKLKGLL